MTDRPLSIGISCYPTFGGSGVIATEVGLGMARRGHRVHLFAYDRPARLDADAEGVVFHRVEVRDYPVFHQPPYALALASRIVDVSRHEPLDALHVHYAVPHATSAYLARELLGERAPRIVTTLHGTDITLIGSDPSYRPITRFSIERSDLVTVPSQWLADETRTRLDLADLPIEVVPNFVDTARFCPRAAARHDGPARLDEVGRSANAHLASSARSRGRAAAGVEGGGSPLSSRARPARRGSRSEPNHAVVQGSRRAVLVHVSNFRAVKRVPDVVAIFAGVLAKRPARLALVGDGPELGKVEAFAEQLGIRQHVDFLGERHDVRGVLAEADLFLMPSASESFGVAALEAQAMGIPVIASRVGGLPEVIAHGETGLMFPAGDVVAMTRGALELLADPTRLAVMGVEARRHAVERFEMEAVLDRYEALYRRALGARGA